jgi:hypothetical protein
MAERNSAASRIHLVAIEPELLDHGDRLDRECFVQFEQIDVRRLQLRAIECLLDGWHGTHAHDGGIDSGGGKREDARQRLPSEHRARSAVATTTAAAPSLMPDALPAVTVPSFLNAGFSPRASQRSCRRVDIRRYRR